MAKFLEHLWLKIIAVLLGLLLWFHVATEKIYNYQLNLPITEVVLDENLTLANYPPKEVMVTVSATGKQLMRKKWRDRGLKIIANHLKQGSHEFLLNTSNTVISFPLTDLTIEEINSPSSVELQVDKIGEREVKVSADLISEADDGFAVSPLKNIIPPKVTIAGPESVIKNIDEILTEHKELTGLRNSLDITLSLVKPNVYGITVSPDTVLFSLEIVPVKTRKFDNVPIAVTNVPPSSNIEIVPAYVNVEITGPPAEIDLLNINALIITCDFRDKDEYGKAVLKIDCPPLYKVKNVSTDTVTINIR
jgi:YbbR domain-containing protein